MFSLFSKDYTTVKVKLSSENNTRLIRLIGLYTYQRSKEVSNSDVISELLERVEKQTIEEEEKIAKSGEKGISKFIMLVGLPGSGKTEYANTMMALDPNVVIISKDDIKVENHIDGAIASEVADARIVNALKDGKTVIYDSRNMNPYARKKRLQLISAIDCKKTCIVLDTPLNVCEKYEVIDEYYLSKRTFYPSYNEGWDEVKVVTRGFTGETETKLLENTGLDVYWSGLSRDSEANNAPEISKSNSKVTKEFEEISELSVLKDDSEEQFAPVSPDLSDFFQRR